VYILWSVQGLLALVFFASGGMKLVRSREALLSQPPMAWANDFTAGQIKLVGTAEVLGAAGLILPRLFGILPILTSIAAACLALLMGGAVATHLRRKESPAVPAVLMLLAVGVAVASAFPS
jgi:uncharacterized membrane protein YphA (DoxX/SURF4 family)